MLIGLHGKAGSGKDAACEFIKEWGAAHYSVRREAFADRLKISAARALGFEGAGVECVDFCNDLKFAATITVEFDNEALKKSSSFTSKWTGWSISGREYLQYYGTEAHREVFGTDFWIDAVRDTYDPEEILVVTDVRFENEARAIREAGGQVWHIIRPEVEIAGNTHASEQPLGADLTDLTITNGGTLDQYRGLILSAIQERVAYA